MDDVTLVGLATVGGRLVRVRRLVGGGQILDRLPLASDVPVSARAQSQPAMKISILEGQVWKLNDLLHALLQQEMSRLSHDPRHIRLFLEFWALGVREEPIRVAVRVTSDTFQACRNRRSTRLAGRSMKRRETSATIARPGKASLPLRSPLVGHPAGATGRVGGSA